MNACIDTVPSHSIPPIDRSVDTVLTLICGDQFQAVLAMTPMRISFRLQEAKGRQPIILIFATSERSPAYENQMTLLEEEPVVERSDALLARIFAEGDSYIQNERMDAASVDLLRSEFGVEDDDFLLVLIGSDGVERRRDDAPLQPSVILERISDATPSR